ncbi:MAG: EamA family transporter [Actinomycetota bacterium]|nr:EamA family transporter [Actinomycetota bacterium]
MRAALTASPAVGRTAPPPNRVAPGWQIWTGLAIVYVVWGSTYLAIRVLVETMPPLLSGGARFMLAGAVLYAFLRWRGGAASMRVDRTQVVSCLIVGSLLVAGGNGLVMVGEVHVPSGLAALIIASVPLWVVLYRRIVGEGIAPGTLAGVAVGFAGLALLLLPSGGNDEVTSWLGLLAVFCAAPAWALGSFLSKRRPLPSNPFLSTSLQMMLGGATSLVAGLARGEAGTVEFASFSSDSLIAFAYLVVIGSLVAFTAYVWLLQHAPIQTVATYAYVNPIIAIVLGWAILSEEITAPIVAGAAIVVASVATIVRKEPA